MDGKKLEFDVLCAICEEVFDQEGMCFLFALRVTTVQQGLRGYKAHPKRRTLDRGNPFATQVKLSTSILGTPLISHSNNTCSINKLVMQYLKVSAGGL